MILHTCYALIWGQSLSENEEIHCSGNTVDGFLLFFFKIFEHFLQWGKNCIDTFILLIKYHKINVVKMKLWRFLC